MPKKDHFLWNQNWWYWLWFLGDSPLHLWEGGGREEPPQPSSQEDLRHVRLPDVASGLVISYTFRCCCCCYQFIFWIEHSISRKKISSKCPILLNSKIELIGNYWWNKQMKYLILQLNTTWDRVFATSEIFKLAQDGIRFWEKWQM